MKKFFLLVNILLFGVATPEDVQFAVTNIDTSGSTFDLYMINASTVGGIQFNHSNLIDITGGSGGLAADNSINIIAGGTTTVIFISFTGTSMPIGEGVISTLTYSLNTASYHSEVDFNSIINISSAVVSDNGGSALTVSSSQWVCAGDTDDTCTNGCLIEEQDLCGICNGDSSTCTGCVDDGNCTVETCGFDSPESDTAAENYNQCYEANGVTAADCTVSCGTEDDTDDLEPGYCCGYAADIVGCISNADACNYDCAEGNIPTDGTNTCGDGVTVDDGTTCSADDCNGDCGGTASIDDCNTCTGGSTGLTANYLQDDCGVCNGSGKDDCGECPGDDGFYGYTGTQTDLGGENSTCTGCMDNSAANYNSTAGDPIQSTNQCSGDGCTLSCGTEDDSDDLEPGYCCSYEVDTSATDIVSFTMVQVDSTATIADSTEFAVYVEFIDNTDLSAYNMNVIYRNWDFGDDSTLVGSQDSEASHMYTDHFGETLTVTLEVITSMGDTLSTSESLILNASLSIGDVYNPNTFYLGCNYPNPFNPATTIEYSVTQVGQASLTIYDVKGHVVHRLLDSFHVPGVRYNITWDSNTQRNSSLPSGIYFYELRSGNQTRMNKMLLIK